ncbi:hypothetical protein B0H11DRAFT_478921 [Mycena galericulata]|nr:hypothetical protein B0H11DRAFT_478921 [Mycena galericulata]
MGRGRRMGRKRRRRRMGRMGWGACVVNAMLCYAMRCWGCVVGCVCVRVRAGKSEEAICPQVSISTDLELLVEQAKETR